MHNRKAFCTPIPLGNELELLRHRVLTYCTIEQIIATTSYFKSFFFFLFFCKCHRANPARGGVGSRKRVIPLLGLGNTQCNGAAKVQVTVSNAFHGYQNHLLNCACRTVQTYPSIHFVFVYPHYPNQGVLRLRAETNISWI